MTSYGISQLGPKKLLAALVVVIMSKQIVCFDVKAMRFFKLTKSPRLTTPKKTSDIWKQEISLVLSGVFSPDNGTYVCSNHFSDREPTYLNPHPTLFVSVFENKHGSTPKKGRLPEIGETSEAQPNINKYCS